MIRPCHDSRALQKERVPGQEGGARAMAARLPHEFTAIDPAVRREIVDLEPADGWPGGAGVLYRPPRQDPDVVVLAMHPPVDFFRHYRSEERRVGKECRYPWTQDHQEKTLPATDSTKPSDLA